MKWEYQSIEVSLTSQDHIKQLDEQGEKGWEVVAKLTERTIGPTFRVFLLMKRPKG